jgi:dTDP-6-deoxy-L-talose 4-dehydrogenase (NAD+)
MRILLTGGTGFIGQPTCDALAGHELLVLTRRDTGVPPVRTTRPDGATLLHGDLFDLRAIEPQIRAFSPDAAIHLAWSDLPDYSLPVCQKNFNAGLDLFRLLRDGKCPRVVVSGTCFEYGNLTGPVAEHMQPTKQGLFAAFKSAQRLVATSVLADSATALLWARPFFVYGPGQRATSLIPSAIAALAAGGKPDIRSPDAVNDFVYVDDVARGLAALATSAAPCGTYNLGSATPTRVRDVVNLVARGLNLSDVYPSSTGVSRMIPSSAGPENHRRDACATNGFWADLTDTLQSTHWRPQVSLEEGIRLTLAAWKASHP